MTIEIERELKSRLLTAIHAIKVDCPECGGYNYDDPHYCCTTCWSSGGDGEISIDEYFNVELTRKKD